MLYSLAAHCFLGVLPRMREWIEISIRLSVGMLITVLPRMREWIEIFYFTSFIDFFNGSPSYEGVD